MINKKLKRIEVTCPECKKTREIARHTYNQKIAWGKSMRCATCYRKSAGL